MANASLKFQTRVELLRYLPGMHVLIVPASVVKKLGGLKVRLICTLNKKISFSAGLMAHGQGAGYIMLSKARMKKAGVTLNKKITIELKLDRSRYGMEMPAELKEILKQDPIGQTRFDALTPGKRRYIIFYVSSVKNTDKRIDRAFRLIENLKALPPGKEPFRKILGVL